MNTVYLYLQLYFLSVMLSSFKYTGLTYIFNQMHLQGLHFSMLLKIVVFVIPITAYLLLAHRNTIDFCVLIMYPF